MPFESKSQFDSLLAMTALFNDTELETFATHCNELLQERKTVARNVLRQELMANLQQTISAILGNGFTLTIENIDDPVWKVCFEPRDHYSIEIE